MGKDKKKGKKKNKKGKTGRMKSFRKMSTGKKVLIGAGVAAVAIGGLFAARYAYKKHQGHGGKLLSADQHVGSREVSARDIGSVAPALEPFLQQAKDVEWNSSNNPILLPECLTFGLGWDSEEQVNLDLLGSVYTAYGQLLGYVQGAHNKSLFNNAITHTGDDTTGGSQGKLSGALGDNENIVLDLRALPPEAATIVVGVQLVQPTNQLAKTYFHIIPLFREEQLPQDVGARSRSAGGDEYESSESEDEDDPDDLAKRADREAFVRLFNVDLDNIPNFYTYRGIVPGKAVKNFQTGQWFFQPLRQIVQVDPQYGLWPWMEQFKMPY